MTDGPGYRPPPPGYGQPPGGYGFPPPGGPGGYGFPPAGGYGGHGGYGPPPGGYYAPYGGYPPYGRPEAPKPGIIPLRPLNVGEILGGAFTAIRWNPGTVLGSSAIFAGVSGVLAAIVTVILEHAVFAQVASFSITPGTLPTAAQVESFLEVFCTLFGVLGAFAAISTSLLTAVLTIAISQAVLGVKVSLGSAFQGALMGLGRLLGTLLLLCAIGCGVFAVVGLIVFAFVAAHQVEGAIIAGVVGGLAAFAALWVAAIRWAIAIPVSMLERAGPATTLSRSWRLVTGNFWRTLGVLVVTGMIVGMVGDIIQVPLSLAGGNSTLFTAMSAQGMAAHQVTMPSLTSEILTAVGATLAQAATAPMTAGVLVLLYADLRMREEGLASALQAAAATPGGQSAGTGEASDVWLAGTGKDAGGPGHAPGPGAWRAGPGGAGGQYPGPWLPLDALLAWRVSQASTDWIRPWQRMSIKARMSTSTPMPGQLTPTRTSHTSTSMSSTSTSTSTTARPTSTRTSTKPARRASTSTTTSRTFARLVADGAQGLAPVLPLVLIVKAIGVGVMA